VIRERLAWYLATCDASTVGEGCYEERVHSSALLAVIEYLFDAFVEERDCADLDADHLFGD